jgi:uncharacterized membrane protein
LPDGVDRYLGQVAAVLRVHPRRRGRVLDELAAHLHESAELHGESEALRRMGDPAAVASAFTPRRRDRLWEERDRLAAAAMLLAMLFSLPMAAELIALNDHVGQSTRWAALVLAPSALLATASCILVLAHRPLGARLAMPLVMLVGATAAMTLLGAGPTGDLLNGYQQGIRHGYETAGCSGRTLGACASDHAAEVRLNFSLGAVALALGYLVAVAGWVPRRPRRRRARVA